MKIFYTFLSLLFLLSNTAYAGDYPKSPEERKAEEIGSILGGDGLIFRPSKIQNNSTRTKGSKANSFMWNASMDILEDMAPISISDKEEGTITTEWYSDREDPNRSYKIKVQISDNVIRPESITTELKSKVLKNGRWLEEKYSGDKATEIENNILRRARQLYIRKSGKK